MCSSARRSTRAENLLVGDAFFLGPFVDRQFEIEHALELFLQPRRIPLLRIGVFRHVLGDQIVDHGVAHVADDFGHHLVVHPFDALIEDHLALVVHHVVELQDVLADVEVARLDLLLRLFQRLVDPGMDDRLVFLQPELGQHAVELVGAEDAHQIVFERQEEFRVAGIALAAGTAAQLVVDAAALVPLGAEHVEAAGGERLVLQTRDLGANFVGARTFLALARILDVGQFLADAHVGIAAELDVGAAAGHVGGDGDRAGNAGLRDDIGLLLVIAGIEDGEHLGLGGALVAGIERGKRVRIGEVVLLPALLAQHFGELLPISRSRWCRPAPAGRVSCSPRSA